MKRIFLVALTITFISGTSSYGQNPYIGSNSVGKVSKPDDAITKQGLRFRPMTSWVGERFIFLPTSKLLQTYGYQSFGLGVSYSDHVGRIAKVTKIDVGDAEEYTVHFKFEDNGDELSATGHENIEGIAPVADLDSARARWIGKTLWYTGREIVSHDEQGEQTGTVMIKKYSPVKIMNVVAGWQSQNPVRFVIKDWNGNEGWANVNLTGTNVPERLRDDWHFEKFFLEQDPRITHPWDAKTWSAIEDGKVFEGMSEEQAEMSWGKPKDINQTVVDGHATVQWVYKSSYLYFTDGLLTSFQN